MRAEMIRVQAKLADAEETVRAIRSGEVDALVLHGDAGEQIFTLKGAESSYRVLVETMSEGAVTFRDDGTILYCNGCFARMVDRPLERVMGAHIEDFIAPRQSELFRALVRQGLERGSKSELIFGGAHARAVPAYVSLSPLSGGDGSRLLCLVATDLSAQKRSEEMLASERLATSVIEQATDSILVCDEDGRIIRASKAVIGFSKHSPLLLRFRDAFPSAALNAIVNAALVGQRSQGIAASLQSEDGAGVDVLASGAPLLGTHGSVIGAIVTIADITSLKQTEKELERAVRIRDEFMLVASHELRTPLTSLQLQLEGLQIQLAREPESMAPATHARWTKKLEIAARQTQRLSKLTETLLDISRLKTGRLKLELEELDLTCVVRDVVKRWSTEAARGGCELRFHDGVPSVAFWDRIRIEQALVNLILNATKYAPGKPIDVSIETKANDVWITIEDRGMGIAPQNLERIFGPFERAVPSAHYGGMGLGLFITRQIAEACGGAIDVTSELGKGSIFRVRLPVRTAPSLAEPERPPQALQAG